MLTKQFLRLVYWHVVRYTRRHPLLAGLNVLSVALGISVFLAIQIASHSANQSFSASIDLVAGKANLEVRSPGGNFDETLLPKLTHAPGVAALTPLVEGYMTLPDYPGEYLQVLGVDIFTNLPFATFDIGHQAATSETGVDFDSWLGNSHAIAIADEFAEQHNLRIGDALRVQINGKEELLTVKFLVGMKNTTAGRGNSRVAALDIGWAQELFHQQGRLTSVQILLNHPEDAESMAIQLGKIVPPDVTVAAPVQRSKQVERMLSSFELNLGALSLISLLVGMFLIYNTITASVVRRRVDTGILRAIGATRTEILGLFLSEAFLFGLIGVVFGILGGILLAHFLIDREIARAIGTLYQLVSVDRFSLTPLLVVLTFLLGLGSVLVAAWLPAYEGSKADPVFSLSLGMGSTMEKSRTQQSRWLLVGLLSLALALGCSFIALISGPAWLGFGSAFFVLLGFAFMAPLIITYGSKLVDCGLTSCERVIAITRGLAPLAKTQSTIIVMKLALQNLQRSLFRNAVVIAALMAAIAMTIGISTMIHAFRSTVETWINRAIVADIFMTPAANEVLGNGAFFPEKTLQTLRKLPGIRAVDTVRETGITFRNNRVSLLVLDGGQQNQFAFTSGQTGTLLGDFHRSDHVLVSEPFATRYHLRRGDRIPIPTPDGNVDYIVAGVYYDYARDSGIVAISRENFLRHWHDDRVMSAAIYLEDASKLDAMAQQLRSQFNLKGEFLIFSNNTLRERIFEIFSQTFRITGILRSIAVVIAVIGIFLTLTTLISERAREIGVLRAIGASRRQIQGIIFVESGMIGLLSSILGIVAGLALSVILTSVINKAFFGWTIQFSVPWKIVLGTPLWIVSSALVAGWIPAVRAGKIPISGAIRAE